MLHGQGPVPLILVHALRTRRNNTIEKIRKKSNSIFAASLIAVCVNDFGSTTLTGVQEFSVTLVRLVQQTSTPPTPPHPPPYTVLFKEELRQAQPSLKTHFKLLVFLKALIFYTHHCEVLAHMTCVMQPWRRASVR